MKRIKYSFSVLSLAITTFCLSIPITQAELTTNATLAKNAIEEAGSLILNNPSEPNYSLSSNTEVLKTEDITANKLLELTVPPLNMENSIIKPSQLNQHFTTKTLSIVDHNSHYYQVNEPTLLTLDALMQSEMQLILDVEGMGTLYQWDGFNWRVIEVSETLLLLQDAPILAMPELGGMTININNHPESESPFQNGEDLEFTNVGNEEFNDGYYDDYESYYVSDIPPLICPNNPQLWECKPEFTMIGSPDDKAEVINKTLREDSATADIDSFGGGGMHWGAGKETLKLIRTSIFKYWGQISQVRGIGPYIYNAGKIDGVRHVEKHIDYSYKYDKDGKWLPQQGSIDKYSEPRLRGVSEEQGTSYLKPIVADGELHVELICRLKQDHQAGGIMYPAGTLCDVPQASSNQCKGNIHTRVEWNGEVLAAVGSERPQGQAYATEALWGGAQLFTDDPTVGKTGAILFADNGDMAFSSFLPNTVKIGQEVGMEAVAKFDGLKIPTTTVTVNGKKYIESEVTPANTEPKAKVLKVGDFRIVPFTKKGHVVLSFKSGSAHRIPEWARTKHHGHVNYAIVGLKAEGSCAQGKVVYGGAEAFAVYNPRKADIIPKVKSMNLLLKPYSKLPAPVLEAKNSPVDLEKPVYGKVITSK